MLAHVRRAPASPEPVAHSALGRSSAGAVAAQATYALSSFALQFAAARLLGLEGLGRYSALYAFLVLTTAVSSGFVGDSLTVLDRKSRAIRAGLQVWLVLITVTAGSIAGTVAWAIGFVGAGTACVFGGATAVFLVEDALRRNLMAAFCFWRVVLVDAGGLLASLGVVLTAHALEERVTLTHLLLALLVGQVCATAVAVVLLPSGERTLVSVRHAAMRSVAAFGAWRAMQQLVRPALLAGVRVLCLVASSVPAVGALEAARVYTAPSMLVVGGLNSYLFASYARSRDEPLDTVIRQVDRTVLALLLAVATAGALAIVGLPVFGPLLSGGEYEISTAAVASWSLFVASIAAVTPFGQLAGVRGQQRRVLAIRLVDSIATLAAVAVGLALGVDVVWVPLILAIGSIGGGLSIRILVLRATTTRRGDVGAR